MQYIIVRVEGLMFIKIKNISIFFVFIFCFYSYTEASSKKDKKESISRKIEMAKDDLNSVRNSYFPMQEWKEHIEQLTRNHITILNALKTRNQLTDKKNRYKKKAKKNKKSSQKKDRHWNQETPVILIDEDELSINYEN
jgi:uncharacterized membrane protein required for colicin V production